MSLFHQNTVVIKHLEMRPGFEIKKLWAADSYEKVAHFNRIMTIAYKLLQYRKYNIDNVNDKK